MNLQEVNNLIDLAIGVVTFLFLLIGGGAGLFIFFQLAPILNLQILSSWTDESKQYLLLRFEIENKSRVRIHNPTIRIQVIEQRISDKGSLSHWVPFRKDAIQPTEQPVEWRDPEDVANTTKRIYPGETIIIERLYHYPQKPLILHVAIQVEIKLGFWGRMVTRKTQNWRQTTTRFVVK